MMELGNVETKGLEIGNSSPLSGTKKQFKKSF